MNREERRSVVRFYRDRFKIPPTARRLLEDFCTRHGIDIKAGLINQAPYLTAILKDTPFDLWPMFLVENPTLRVEGESVVLTDLGRRFAESKDQGPPLTPDEEEIDRALLELENRIQKELKNPLRR